MQESHKLPEAAAWVPVLPVCVADTLLQRILSGARSGRCIRSASRWDVWRRPSVPRCGIAEPFPPHRRYPQLPGTPAHGSHGRPPSNHKSPRPAFVKPRTTTTCTTPCDHAAAGAMSSPRTAPARGRSSACSNNSRWDGLTLH
ncbi:hypothetical protein C8Q78DRAFT_358672 [Trametes maxima]|nr:hypothetical protein C8Q78DRAFT_358672 [Trametes maxima]